MTYTFRPRGVCSQEMRVEVDDAGIIQKMEVLGGCSGNLQGISALVVGMPAQEAIHRLKGHPLRCQEHLLPRPVRLRAGVRPGQTEISLRQALRHLPQGLLFRVRSEIPQATKFPGQAIKNMVN